MTRPAWIDSDAAARLVADSRAIYDAAVAAVRPDVLFRAFDHDALLPRPLAAARGVRLVAAGKAALPMTHAALGTLGVRPRVHAGVVVVPRGYAPPGDALGALPPSVALLEAGHPVPDAASARAAGRVLALAADAGADDAVLVLLSGGASALLAAPAPGVSVDDVGRTVALLLGSGADIHDTNVVRKHLTRVGGGRLAAACHPAAVAALVLSDVVGDDLSTIASGPTVADASTFADAVRVLRERGLWDAVPAAVRDHLRRGLADASMETPKPGAALLARARTALLGTNRLALDAGRAEAARRGYDARIAGDRVTGEARAVGAGHAAALRAVAHAPTCLLWGGEPTVTVRGAGRGGRSQEVALGAARVLRGADRPLVLLAAGTDGVDGPTDAAGAWATPATAGAGAAMGLDLDAALADNDAYPYLDALGALLRVGPTHTNVMDVHVGMAG